MKFIFAAILSVFLAPVALWAESNISCSIPYSHSAHIEFTIDPEDPIIPVVLIQAVETTNAVAATAGALANVGVMQVAHHARMTSILKIVSCKNDFAPQDEAPAFLESPTQLSIGDGVHQYDLGTVIGNWVLQGGIAIVWVGAAKYLGDKETRFPGGLAIPAMILLVPTTTASFNLFHYSSNSERGLGFLSLASEAAASGAVAILLHPSFFKARWSKSQDKWVDGRRNTGFVARYGPVFEDYRNGAPWFLDIEMLMSVATGVLNSYQETGAECKRVVTSAAALSTAYALTFISVRPNTERRDLIIFGTIAGIQAFATTLQATSLLFFSEETQEKTRAAAKSMILAAESALSLKTFYDIGSNIKSAVQYLCSRLNPLGETAPVELQEVLTQRKPPPRTHSPRPSQKTTEPNSRKSSGSSPSGDTQPAKLDDLFRQIENLYGAPPSKKHNKGAP